MSLLKRLAGDTSPPPVITPVATPNPAPETAVAAPQPASLTPITASSGPGASATTAPVVVKPSTDNSQIVELSLQITDRILASLGSSQQLDHTPESERMLQERFANYYRQMNTTVGEGEIKQLYDMVLTEIFGFGPIQRLL